MPSTDLFLASSLVLLACEAVEQGLYFGSRGAPKVVGWVLFYGGAFVECARGIAAKTCR